MIQKVNSSISYMQGNMTHKSTELRKFYSRDFESVIGVHSVPWSESQEKYQRQRKEGRKNVQNISKLRIGDKKPLLDNLQTVFCFLFC